MLHLPTSQQEGIMKAYKLILVGFAIVLLLFLLIFYGFQKIDQTEYRIFADIAECEQIVSNKPGDAQIEVYETAEKDKYLRNLEYEAFFGATYASMEMRFQLFAYDFADSETARAYYEAVTGKDGALITDVLAEKGLFSSDLIVRVDDKAYRVKMPSRYTRRVTDYLNEIFTFSTKETYTLHLLTPLTEEMVRFYYDLTPEDEITQEMLNGVTSLFVTVRQEWNFKEDDNEQAYYRAVLAEAGTYTPEEIREKYFINYCVNYAETEGDSFAVLQKNVYMQNGSYLYGTYPETVAEETLPYALEDYIIYSAPQFLGSLHIIPKRYFETIVRPAWEMAWGEEAYLTKFTRSYYAYKELPQPSDVQINSASIRISERYTGEADFYYFDPGAASWEYVAMTLRFLSCGLLDHRILESAEIDETVFEVFPNLTDLSIRIDDGRAASSVKQDTDQ